MPPFMYDPRRIFGLDNNSRKLKTKGAVGSASSRQASAPKAAETPAPRKPQKKRPLWVRFLRFCAYCCCVGVILCSILAVFLSKYVVDVTEDDAELLNLDNLRLSMSTINYDRYGNEYSTFSGNNQRIWVDESEVPEYLKWAIICTEDKDFYQERWGVNFKRTIAAFINEYTPIKLFDSRQGASTLEQQLIKNLTNDDDVDAMRKVREIFRAIGLSNRYSKQKILEAYMNTISLTGTIAGVQAGAQEYFGKDVSDLTLAECAVIAGITKNPTRYNPFTNPEDVLTRRNDILYFMYTQGKITEEEYTAASAEPLVLVESKNAAQTSTATSNNSYFTDALYYEVLSDLQTELGMSADEARNMIYNGGLRIYTTVDTELQLAAERIMLDEDGSRFKPLWHEEEVTELAEDDIPVYEEDGVTLKTSENEKGETVYYRKVRSQGSLVVVDYDGQVQALVGGIGEKTKDLAFNRAIAPHQTGSTMKPVAAYSLGIEYKLINYGTVIPDSPLYTAADRKVLNTDYCLKYGYSLNTSDPRTLANDACWRDWPVNYSGAGSGKNVTVSYAIAQSLNTVAAWVGSFVGIDNMYNFVTDTLELEYITEADKDYSPLVLGGQSQGLTAVELAGVYTMFNDGSYTKPYMYTRIETYTGDVLIDKQSNATTIQAISEETATIMNRLLANVVRSGGTAAGKKPAGQMDAAAKTGTTSDFKDFTFVGMTPYYVTALWWGFDTPYSFDNFGIRSGTPTQQAWKDLMEEVQADLEYKEFFFSDNVIVQNGGYYTADNVTVNTEPDTATTTETVEPAPAA